MSGTDVNRDDLAARGLTTSPGAAGPEGDLEAVPTEATETLAEPLTAAAPAGLVAGADGSPTTSTVTSYVFLQR
ncbi:MAG: hypothetical protein HC904_13235 [Blastochloris sp.]|nr:hypothetical protein [Blastochloris sp.]